MYTTLLCDFIFNVPIEWTQEEESLKNQLETGENVLHLSVCPIKY